MHSKLPKRDLDSFIVPSTGLLKSSYFLCTLPILTYMMLLFHFEQIQSVSVALRAGHLRVAGISFYMRLQKFTYLHYKKRSHSKLSKVPTTLDNRVRLRNRLRLG